MSTTSTSRADFDAQIARARAVKIERELERRGVTNLTGKKGMLSGPCPVCGGTDRFAINIKKQLFHCRKCGGQGGGAIDLVMFVAGVSFIRAVEILTGYRPEPVVAKPVEYAKASTTTEQDEAEQHRRAAWLWSQRRPIAGTLAERYLRSRHITCPLPPTLAFLPPSGDYPPSMIAAYALPNEIEPGLLGAPRIVRSVHVTRLLLDGSGRERGKAAKKTIGRPLGNPIVLAPVNDALTLTITEGIEDALSVFQATGLGAWAAGSAPYMLSIEVPDYIDAITIIADADEAGQRGAIGLAQRLHQRGGIEIFLEGVAP